MNFLRIYGNLKCQNYRAREKSEKTLDINQKNVNNFIGRKY